MAKGIKMDAARHPYHGVVPVRALVDGDVASLTCTGCKAKIGYVREHRRELEYVHAFLRLLPIESHKDDCENAIQVQVLRIVRDSIEATGHELLEATAERHVFRLHVLTERYFDDLRATEQKGDSPDRVWIRYQQAANTLDPYIRTASALALLYARTTPEDHVALRDSIAFSMNGKKVAWKHFVYDEPTYGLLVSRLSRGPMDHPVAVLINVQRIVQTEKQRIASRFVQCSDGQYAVSAFFDHGGEIMNRMQIEEGLPYLVIGKARLNGSFVNLSIRFPSQISEVARTKPFLPAENG